jgi:hypothetical protein
MTFGCSKGQREVSCARRMVCSRPARTVDVYNCIFCTLEETMWRTNCLSAPLWQRWPGAGKSGKFSEAPVTEPVTVRLTYLGPWCRACRRRARCRCPSPPAGAPLRLGAQPPLVGLSQGEHLSSQAAQPRRVLRHFGAVVVGHRRQFLRGGAVRPYICTPSRTGRAGLDRLDGIAPSPSSLQVARCPASTVPTVNLYVS